jgi:hypothetical protein
MNLQSIVDPLGEFMVWTFDTLIVPFADYINWAAIVVGGIGFLFWMKTQSDYNKKAAKDGTLA